MLTLALAALLVLPAAVLAELVLAELALLAAALPLAGNLMPWLLVQFGGVLALRVPDGQMDFRRFDALWATFRFDPEWIGRIQRGNAQMAQENQATAMAVAGMAWIATANSLTLAAQMALPNWVRARGMSIYQMCLMGGSAVGSLLWGKKLEAGSYSPKRTVLQMPVEALTAHGGHGGGSGFTVPGTFVLALIFLASFVLYYFVNWKYLSSVWGLS